MKAKCRLCELGLGASKLGAAAALLPGLCNHTGGADLGLTTLPTPLGQFYHFAGFVPQQLRDMMIAACMFRGYYQPAGPLITAHHGHMTAPVGPAPVVQQAPPQAPAPQAPPAKTIDATPSPTPPSQPPPTASAPSTGTNESSDNEVILTSATSGGSTESSSAPPPSSSTSQGPVYRYPPQYSGGYPYGYVTSGQYYQSAPPHHSMHYHDMCYPPPGPYGPATYLHPKPYPTTFRRYLPPPTGQYYTSPPELYPPPSNQPSTQVVSAGAAPGSGGGGGPGQGYQAPPGTGPPPPPTIVDTYAGPPPPTIVETYAPPPAHYYGYGAPQPTCYSHSQPTRSIFIDPAYQSCPCPMQSCPKNVHTGPLTGDSKRSNMTTSIAKESVPLPPVALALPLEPASVAGPPSPARGSAGMPPPPSPAGAVYQPVPPKTPTTETMVDCKPVEEKVRRKARVGKTMVKNNLINSCKQVQQDQNQILQQPNTMLLMCHNPPSEVKEVKREVESPEELLQAKNERIPNLEESKTEIKTGSEIKDDITISETNKVQNKQENIDNTRLSLNVNGSSMENKNQSQKLEGEDHEDQILPPDSTPTRRKSLDETTKIPENVCETLEIEQNLEKTIEINQNGLEKTVTPTKKRKISLLESQEEIEEEIVQPKKSKVPVSKSSYKNLIKKSPKVKKLYNLSSKKKINSNSDVKTPNKIIVKKKKVKRKAEGSQIGDQTVEVPTKKQKATTIKDEISKKKVSKVLPTLEESKVTNGEVLPTLDNKKQKNDDVLTTVNNKKQKSEEVLPINNNKKQKSETLPTNNNKKQKITKKLNGTNSTVTVKVKTDQLAYTEPSNKIIKNQNKQNKVNSNTNNKTKKLAPEILDSLFTKNNVDRTIESVILNSVNLCSENDKTVTLTSKSRTQNISKTEKVLQQLQNQTPDTDSNKNNSNLSNSKCSKDKSVSKNLSNGVLNDNSKNVSVSIPSAQVTGSQVVKTGASKRKNKSVNNGVNGVSNVNGGSCGVIDNGKIKSEKVTTALAVPKIPRRSIHAPKWSNGWSWEGDSYQGKVFLNSDQELVVRTCYPAMRHIEGDLITPRDSVLLKAGPRKIDLPFVAKVAALWENPDDGEMMMSLLWYYRPEHTEQGRLETDQQDEVFASRHKDTNSVACIEDKCYVLTFNEYCRYRKTIRRIEEGVESTGPIVPLPDGGQYHRAHRQPPASPELALSPDLVFFCRRVYDFRQKRLVKNPS